MTRVKFDVQASRKCGAQVGEILAGGILVQSSILIGPGLTEARVYSVCRVHILGPGLTEARVYSVFRVHILGPGLTEARVYSVCRVHILEVRAVVWWVQSKRCYALVRQGSRVYGSECSVQDSGCRIQGAGCRVQGPGFGVQDLGSRT